MAAAATGNPAPKWNVGASVPEREDDWDEGLGEWQDSLEKIVQGGAADGSGTSVDGEGMGGESIGSALKHAQEWVTDKATSPWRGVRRRLYPERKPASASKEGGSRPERKARATAPAHRGMAFEIVAGAADTVRYAGEMVGLFKPRPPVALAAHHRSSSGRSKPRRSREQSSPGGRANSVGTVQRRHVVAEGGSERGGGDVGIEPAGRDREGAGASEEMHGGGVSSRPPCSADGDGGGQGCGDSPAELSRGASMPVAAKRSSERRRVARHNSWSGDGAKEDDRLPVKSGPPDMEWLCLPYYLLHGYIHMTFITDKAHNMDKLGSEQKQAMLCLLALSVCNFLSTTTTLQSPLPFLVIRGLCDTLNIAHSVVLILISIWVIEPRIELQSASLYHWLADFPSLAYNTGLPGSHVGAIIGLVSLLLGLVRVASDLKIDTTPRIMELPVCLCGILLLALIPANVGYYPGERSGGAEDAVVSHKGEVATVTSGYVLTSGLVLALVDLGAPPQRAFGAPLVAMVVTSLWSLSVAAAGILLGPDALPWPGMPFFVLLPVACLLLSKHI